MKSEKNTDDLSFMPLNISAPLDPNGSKFPLNFQCDCMLFANNSSGNSLGFPSFNVNPSPMPLNTTPIVQQAPLTPYPQNIPTLDSTSQNNFNSNIGSESQSLEFPSENSDDILYSYNENRVSEEYLNNVVNPLDILINFDLTLDFDEDSRKESISESDVENIFSQIEKKNPGILATMKAYRIPYPISKILIKKIIKISIDSYKG